MTRIRPRLERGRSADSRSKRRPVGRPAAAESAETRARILSAAREHFAASGYARAGNQAIAAAADVTPTALYHYFASKADLFAAAHEAALAVLLDAYRAAVASTGDAVEQLCAIVATNADLNRAHPGLAEFLALAPLEAQRHPELAAKIGSARGLLWAFDSLYVVVNAREPEKGKKGGRDISGLYRVTASKKDDDLDTVELLRQFEGGGGEHGPHAVMMHPDGKRLTVVCGNQTKLTKFDTTKVPPVLRLKRFQAPTLERKG